MSRAHGQRFLVAYSGVLTLVFALTVLTGFSGGAGGSGRFDTITVQRINIVEPDGRVRMVLSNNQRIPSVIIRGHEYADYGGRKASTAAGILFYDAEATESGGLTFGGRTWQDGSITRWGHLSFDRYNQDQMFTIDAQDDGTNHASAIAMIDQPNWPIEEYLQLRDRIRHLPPAQQQAAINAFFVTHPPTAGIRTLLSHENYPSLPTASANGLQLFDAAFKERSRLRVGADGNALLQFRDAQQQVTHTYPPE